MSVKEKHKEQKQSKIQTRPSKIQALEQIPERKNKNKKGVRR